MEADGRRLLQGPNHARQNARSRTLSGSQTQRQCITGVPTRTIVVHYECCQLLFSWTFNRKSYSTSVNAKLTWLTEAKSQERDSRSSKICQRTVECSPEFNSSCIDILTLGSVRCTETRITRGLADTGIRKPTRIVRASHRETKQGITIEAQDRQ